jgi:hypothetical protein
LEITIFMSMNDELERLSKLHKEGTLNDEEFAKAKGKLLSQPAASEPTERDNSRDETANRFVMVALSVIGIIILLFLFGVVLPHMHRGHWHRWAR